MIDQIILEDIERIKSDLKREDLEGKRVLVTGGAGFIGGWLCDVLVSFDAEVACLDNLSTGKMENMIICWESRNLNLLMKTSAHLKAT